MTEEETQVVEQADQPAQATDQATDSEEQHAERQEPQKQEASQRKDVDYNWSEARRRMAELERIARDQQEVINRLQHGHKDEPSLAEDDLLTVKDWKKLNSTQDMERAKERQHYQEELFEKSIDCVSTYGILLYGEGYGPKIQSTGPKYRSDVGFILFDVVVGDHWLNRESVKDMATKLDIPYVPDIGIMTEEEIVAYIKSKPLSQCSTQPQVMEGIVARAEPALYFKHGDPVMFKLKCKEFV